MKTVVFFYSNNKNYSFFVKAKGFKIVKLQNVETPLLLQNQSKKRQVVNIVQKLNTDGPSNYRLIRKFCRSILLLLSKLGSLPQL